MFFCRRVSPENVFKSKRASLIHLFTSTDAMLSREKYSKSTQMTAVIFQPMGNSRSWANGRCSRNNGMLAGPPFAPSPHPLPLCLLSSYHALRIGGPASRLLRLPDRCIFQTLPPPLPSTLFTHSSETVHSCT